MSRVSMGDLSQTFLLHRQTTDLKTALARLTQEMASGTKSDLAAAVGGDFRALAGIDHRLAMLSGYKTAGAEATLFAETLQSALGTVGDLASDMASALTSAGAAGGPAQVQTAGQDARQKLHSAVAALNARVGDRYLLSGAATDKKPILGSDAILSALTTATAGQVTASGLIAAVDGWFDAPPGGGGYLDTVYGGSSNALAPFRIGEDDGAAVTLTAADSTLRETLKGLALGALVAQGALPGDATGRALVTRTAGERLAAAGTSLTYQRADLGSVESHIADIVTRNTSETSALTLARNDITAADPYQTGTELQAAQTQLETLYTITAQLAHLSLADFLR